MKDMTSVNQNSGSWMNRPFWKVFGAIGDFFVLNCFWLLGCLPIVTIGTSTTAIFYVFLKRRRGEGGPLWGMYKKSFRENLKQSIFIWLIFLFLIFDVVLVCMTMIQSGRAVKADFLYGGKYFVTLAVLGCIFVSVLLYSFALLALFRQTITQCIVSAVGLSFGKIGWTLVFLLIIAGLALLTYYVVPPLFFLDVPLAVCLISCRMNLIFDRQIAVADKNKKESGQ
jgi:uncharacterized membrane protein YesL